MSSLKAAYQAITEQTVVARNRDVGSIASRTIVFLRQSDETSLITSGMSLALATSPQDVQSQLGFHRGSLSAGAATAAGDYGVVTLRGVLRITDTWGGIANGDLFYVSDLGALSPTAGTTPRVVAQALIGSFVGVGAYLDIWFDGTALSPVQSFPATSTDTYLPQMWGANMLKDSSLSQDATGAIRFQRGLCFNPGVKTVADGASETLTAGSAYWRIYRGAAGVPGRTVVLPTRPADGTVLIIADADGSAAASNIALQVADGSHIQNAGAPFNLTVANRVISLCYNDTTAPTNWEIWSLV